MLKKIWEKKDILIIEGENSRIGVGNDLINIICLFYFCVYVKIKGISFD